MNVSKVISDHDIAVLHYSGITHQNSLHASRRFKKGEVFTKFRSGKTQQTPTRFTIQLSESEHIELHPAFLQFINHSCNPNLFFDTTLMQIFCLENVSPGDELTFFYPSTEWDINEVFICTCGSRLCLGEIKGAAYMSPQTLNKYKFTRFIEGKLQFLYP